MEKSDQSLIAEEQQIVVFNRFACFWPKGYQRVSLVKSHQNGDYLKQAMRKKLSSHRIRTCRLWIIGPLL